MSYEYLRGRRFINLVRCSSDEQADTSPKDQNNILIEFGIDHGMVHAGDDVVLEGVTGSVPASRPDIQRIVNRKREFDDFDVVLVQDFSRFTRGGIDHAGSIKIELAKEGIEVIFVTFGSTGDVDQDSLIQGIGFYAAQQQAKSMSYNATRGQMSSMQAGNLPHTFHMPFGIDRLYVGADGKPRHRIRNLTDGTQQKLEPDRDVVTAIFGRNPK
jgi:DNA invertase Pin-like site-specific DNA recombinase